MTKQIEQENRNLENIKNIDLIEKVSGQYSLYGHSGGNALNITKATLIDENTLIIHFLNYQRFCKHNPHGNMMFQTVYEGNVKFTSIEKKVKEKKKKNSLVALEVQKKDRKGLIHVKLHLSSMVLEFKCREIECVDYYSVDNKPKAIASLNI